ncbi:MAG: hypothetical protein E7256_10755 [Lachnospiraceae bacterium]|nr:hypothetical protein [Lachnospiraceae bacterium]
MKKNTSRQLKQVAIETGILLFFFSMFMLIPNTLTLTLFLSYILIVSIVAKNPLFCLALAISNAYLALGFTAPKYALVPSADHLYGGILLKTGLFLLFVCFLFFEMTHLGTLFKARSQKKLYSILLKALPITSYILLSFVLIIGFTNLYCTQNYLFDVYQIEEGFFSGSMERLPIYHSMRNFPDFVENLYFSSTTYYTVGFGDIIIEGVIPKLTAQLEMAFSNIMMLVYIPITLQSVSSNSES